MRGVLLGFQQYPVLPVFYGLANAFILGSTSEQWGLVVNEAMASGLPVLISKQCGCAVDLVHYNRNGFTFDPYKWEELAGFMIKLGSGECDLNAMGKASRQIIEDWGKAHFAENLLKAAKVALSTPKIKLSHFDMIMLNCLGFR